jgi:uncharacterized membrane protein
MQAAPPLFAATLTPHRALSRRAFRIVIVVLAILASIPGIVLFSLGAWPVVGFLGLDVLVVWWALSASVRDGRRRERVTLWLDALEILAVDGRGKVTRTEFAPFHVRLLVDRDYDERTTRLRLRDKDRELEIGRFLNPEDKASFARSFGTVLKKARGPNPAPAHRPLSGDHSNRKS